MRREISAHCQTVTFIYCDGSRFYSDYGLTHFAVVLDTKDITEEKRCEKNLGWWFGVRYAFRP